MLTLLRAVLCCKNVLFSSAGCPARSRFFEITSHNIILCSNNHYADINRITGYNPKFEIRTFLLVTCRSKNIFLSTYPSTLIVHFQFSPPLAPLTLDPNTRHPALFTKEKRLMKPMVKRIKAKFLPSLHPPQLTAIYSCPRLDWKIRNQSLLFRWVFFTSSHAFFTDPASRRS
jgi:hypothetical protein